MACKDFDGQVVRQAAALGALLDRFVCVRLVRMNRVDLSEFQFDYDLKWAAVFKHADGAVFGRYGSHLPSGPMGNNSMAGLRRTLERVLEAHRDYPANRETFAAKKGPVPLYRQVSEAPSRRIRKILAKRGREGCVHCHNVYDSYHDRAVEAGTYDPQTVWKYPLPENIGLQIDPDDGRRIARVEPESPAA